MEDSTLDNTEANFPEYNILGKELTTFVLQVGFVEGIIDDSKAFDILDEAYQHIFRNNKEYAIAMWNGIPFKLSYKEDIPFMITGLVRFLWDLQNGEPTSIFRIKTKNIEFIWTANCTAKMISINGEFIKVTGNYEKALQSLCMLKMNTHLFLNEWKLLLEQLLVAMERSGSKLTSKQGQQALKHLQNLNETIVHKGLLYS